MVFADIFNTRISFCENLQRAVNRDVIKNIFVIVVLNNGEKHTEHIDYNIVSSIFLELFVLVKIFKKSGEVFIIFVRLFVHPCVSLCNL